MIKRRIITSWATLALLGLLPVGILPLAGCSDDKPAEEHAEAGGHDEGSEGEAGHSDEEGEAHEGHDEGSKAEAGHADEEGVVKLAPGVIERNDIVVDTVRRGAISGAVSLPANVHLNADRTAHVTPRIEGKLLRIPVSIGDKVKRGQTMAVISSVQLGQARAELERAKASLSVAKSNYDRQKGLLEMGIASERSFLEAEGAYEQAQAQLSAAEAQLQAYGVSGGTGPEMNIESPLAGTVLERNATVGETVSPSDVLFKVAELQDVWVMGKAYEVDIAGVKEGMPAIVRLKAYPSRSFPGRIDYVASSLGEETRAANVRVTLNNPDGLLRPGMVGEVELSPEGASESLVVPSEAIQDLDGGKVVFVVGGEPGEFRPVPVVTGQEANQQVEIIDGLTPGQKIATRGTFILKSQLKRGELSDGHAH